MTMLLNKRGDKVVRMSLEDGRTIFVNLKKLTQHKAQLVDTQSSQNNSEKGDTLSKQLDKKKQSKKVVQGVTKQYPDNLIINE